MSSKFCSENIERCGELELDGETLKAVGQTAGLAGIAIALATFVFRDIIRRNIFPNLTRMQGYRLLRLIVVLSSVLAALGIAAWVLVTVQEEKTPEEKLKEKAEAAIKVPSEDLSSFADFLKQPGSRIVRIHQREDGKFIEAAGIQGGGSYYSFLSGSQEYGLGSDLGYTNGKFYTGFAGADYGYLVSLGDTPLDKLVAANQEPPGWLDTISPDAWRYIWTYSPPTDIEKIREHQDAARALIIGGTTMSEQVAAIEGNSYLLRSIRFGDADILIAFRSHRKLDDNSFIVAGRIVKNFSTPVIVDSE